FPQGDRVAEVKIRVRRVEAQLDTQLTLAGGESRAQVAENAHVTHATREEFIEFALWWTCRHGPRIRSGAGTMNASPVRRQRMTTRSGAARIARSVGAAERSAVGASHCRRGSSR